MAQVGNARGLKNYIQEIRSCATKEAEAERVRKELGKIRKKYTSNKSLTTYDKKKYLWKLMYTKMLGYDVDFGHKQAMDMMAASTYAEKQVGYVVCGLFLSENDALLRLVINSVRTDLLSRNEAFQCLALEFTANVGGAEFAQLLAADVLSVVAHGATRPLVRKKAAFCMLRLLRKSVDGSIVVADEWGVRMATLLEDNDLGVLLGLTSLLIGVVAKDYRGYEACVPKLVEILERLRERDVPQHYTYYGIPTPWLQVKILRALQYFPAPEDPGVLKSLKHAIRDIITGNDPVKNPNKNNAVHAIVFEAAATAVSIDDEELMLLVVNLMVRFLAVREANLRYLALENLGRLSQPYQISRAIAKHRKTIIACMTDPDSSIAGGALNLLFTTANKDTGSEIVDELLPLIEATEEPLRQDLVLKAAILAERFPSSPGWYVDTMLRLIIHMGDVPSDEIWHSVLHLVSSREDLHAHAVEKTVSILQAEDGTINEALLQCAAYILGEYGGADAVEVHGVNGVNGTNGAVNSQFLLLHRHYHAASPQAKAMMLNCYEKMRTRAPATLAKTIDAVMDSERRSIDPEIQQRALEYFALASNPEMAGVALKELPKWEVKNSVLLRKLIVGNDLDDQSSREFQPAWLEEDDGADDGAEGAAAAAAAEGAEVPVAADDVPLSNREDPGSQPPVADLMDLLSFGDEGGAGAADNSDPSDPFTSVTAAATNDLSPVVDETTYSPHEEERQDSTAHHNPLFGAAPEALRLVPPVSDLNALYGAQSGVLFEDHNLQVGVRMHSEADAQTVVLGFYIGNKTGDEIKLRTFVPMHVDAGRFVFSFPEPPPTILPGQQVHISTSWTCLRPYSEVPAVELEYTTAESDAKAARILALPLTPNKFSTPASIPAEMFLKRWNQVNGPPFKLGRSLGGNATWDTQAVEDTLVAFGMQPVVVPALGAGAVNAASIFHCASGTVKAVPCMVRVSPQGKNTGGALIEVATADEAVSLSMLVGLVGVFERIL